MKLKSIFEFDLEVKKKFRIKKYDDETKKILVNYLKKKTHDEGVVGGSFYDCVTGDKVSIETVERNDGKYVWFDDDTYHIEKYNAAVTDEFLQYVLDKSI